MDITGIIKVKGEEQQVSEKFKKRDLILTDNSSQYPQHISFQLTQDKCSLIDAYKVGDEVKVYFNLRGREWTSPQGEVKYFNTLEAWRLEGGAKAGSAPAAAQSSNNSIPNDAPTTFTAASDQDDDLPF
jgi:Domain of unknown function (DUF3127)